MRVAHNDEDDKAGLRGYVQLTKYTDTRTQCELYNKMPTMTGLDCTVMCNLINTHTHTPLCRV